MHKLKMTIWTLVLGLTLNGVGILSYMLSDTGSVTSLIPAFCGGLFLVLGGMSFADKLRMHVLHVSLLVALLLGLYGVYKVFSMLGALSAEEPPTALQMFAFESLGIACLTYVGIGVHSFVSARRSRRQASKLTRAADKAEAESQM